MGNQKKGSSEFSTTNLFVRNVAPGAEEKALEAHFGGIGPLRACLIVRDPETGKSRRFAFVHYALAEHAATAVNLLHGSTLLGQALNVAYARHRQRKAKKGNNTDDEGDDGQDNILQSKRRKIDPAQAASDVEIKRKASVESLGKRAMRTVVLRRQDGAEMTEVNARAAFEGIKDVNIESVVLTSHAREARCTFKNWAMAGKAAASVHGKVYDAVIDALSDGSRTTVIVRNIPFRISSSVVRAAFTPFVPVRNVRLSLPSSRVANALATNTNKSSEGQTQITGSTAEDIVKTCGGYAFVELFTVADTNFAISKVNGAEIGGRVIAVDISIDRSEYRGRVTQDDTESEGESEIGDESDSEEDEDHGKEDATVNDLEDAAHAENKDQSKQKALKEKPEKMQNKERKQASSSPEEMERTVFVNNLLFECTSTEIWQAMERAFGSVEQAVIVKHPITGQSRGVAFVRFVRTEDAQRAVEAAAGKGDGVVDDATASTTQGVWVRGRRVFINKATSKEEAANRKNKDEKKDPRNLHLAWVGRIDPESAEGKRLPPDDLKRRAKAEQDKRIKLSHNPNTFVSNVRLSVRNLPRNMNQRLLRILFARAARLGKRGRPNSGGNGADEGKIATEDDTNTSHGFGQGRIVHCNVVTDGDRGDRSKGYGFVEFERHKDAMLALKTLNNNVHAMKFLLLHKNGSGKEHEKQSEEIKRMWGQGRRLIVEFSVEDCRQVRILQRIKQKGNELRKENRRKKMSENEMKVDSADGANGVNTNPGKKNRKRRKNKEKRSEDDLHESHHSANSDNKSYEGKYRNVKRRRHV